jgi:hypothetical protein
MFFTTLNTIKNEVKGTENNLNSVIIINEQNRNKDFKILNERIDKIFKNEIKIISILKEREK